MFKYETHLHTSETSVCGVTSATEHVRCFKELGYTGIFVTDHFYTSYAEHHDNLTWEQHIDLFCRGYEVAEQAGKSAGLDVFLGWEHGEGWAHFLTYGLNKDWLLAHPDLPSWSIEQYFDRVHADGGFIVHAHPFREKVDRVILFPTKVDAVEVLNMSRIDDANRHARDFAESFGLLQTAGSDIHNKMQKRLGGVYSPHRFGNIQDYVAALKAGETVMFAEPNAGLQEH